MVVCLVVLIWLAFNDKDVILPWMKLIWTQHMLTNILNLDLSPNNQSSNCLSRIGSMYVINITGNPINVEKLLVINITLKDSEICKVCNEILSNYDVCIGNE